jgi:hypothetical protein
MAPDYGVFYRACGTFRVRLADPTPLAPEERQALAEMLNAFEEMMTGTRGLIERIGQIAG